MTTTTLALPERFAVEVTADDILHGEPSLANHCPIALAVIRWLRSQEIAFVAVSVASVVYIHLDVGTPARYWHDADSLIREFDDGNAVEPRIVVLAKLP